MTKYQQFRAEKISPERLLTMAVNILHKAFHDSPRQDAKRRYQFVIERQPVFLLNVTMESGNELRVTVSMERSELRGRLNFSLFRQLIAQMLVNYSDALNSGKTLQTFADANGRRWVFMPPTFCNTDAGLNALVLALDLSRVGELRMELMFVDPEQFKKTDAAG